MFVYMYMYFAYYNYFVYFVYFTSFVYLFLYILYILYIEHAVRTEHSNQSFEPISRRRFDLLEELDEDFGANARRRLNKTGNGAHLPPMIDADMTGSDDLFEWLVRMTG